MSNNVVPTKNNLMNARRSLKLAKVGYDLMDRKRGILMREISRRNDEAVELQRNMALLCREAYYALSMATVSMGLCDKAAQSTPPDSSLTATTHSVMGVELPLFTLGEERTDFYYGMESTCSELDEAYLKFIELKHMAVRYAELEASVMRLADAVKKAGKRTNALKNVMIPQLTGTVKFISDALEEKEREEFFRLKVIKKNK